jgi:ComF family protein
LFSETKFVFFKVHSYLKWRKFKLNQIVSAFPQRLTKAILDAIFPAKCVVCGLFFDLPAEAHRRRFLYEFQDHNKSDGSFFRIIKQLFDRYLCPDCVNDVVPVGAPMCEVCGYMFKSKQGDNRLCEACISSPKCFRFARAPVVYDRAFMSLIHSFKYRSKIQLAKPLGGLLCYAFQRWWHKEDLDMVMPVPLHSSRFKRRGYNQAFLLIDAWKKIAAETMPDSIGLRFNERILVRNRSTVPQTGLGRSERMANMKNAFDALEPRIIRGRRILLIDDVYTTGATANECARELLNSGAQFVDVLTVARAM